ncbi:unnamed protein product [Brachionus calyciflorus]|uniref:Uncharacterized protein n=1 Tax=Brachionus calyciflorus TaxID=104777 RepID=A0A813ZDG7_9BILA|nr:unnamed protein product [Brachionus calyciflorus]
MVNQGMMPSPTVSTSGSSEPSFQSKTVECLIQPILNQLNQLNLASNPHNTTTTLAKRKKGTSKKANHLVEMLIKSIELFLHHANDLIQENTEYRDEIIRCINEIRQNGNLMIESSRDFAQDPVSVQKRLHMVKISKDLLNSIANLLQIGDLIDSNVLLRSIKIVQQDLINLKQSNNQDELTNNFKDYGRDLIELTNLAGKRQALLNDLRLKDELASCRAILKRNSLKLFTSSKTLIRHPELSASQINHDLIYRELNEALERIHNIVTNRLTSDSLTHLYDETASLSAAFDELDKQIVSINPMQFNEQRMRLKLETQLENIISAVALMADSESTRGNRRDRIVNECNVLRQALQDLLNAYVNNKSNHSNEQIENATGDMTKLTRNLRRLLRKAVIDHISDSFIEINLPLDSLIEIAKSHDDKKLDEYSQIFLDHAEKLLEVSSMACSMSNNLEGIKLVRMAAIQVQLLTPQVINAAKILSSRQSSKVALENMEVFRDLWCKNVKLLTDSVDDITQINDFLSVSENHILDDLNRSCLALRELDADLLDRLAGAIRGRCIRVCNVVLSETDLYEPDEVINKINDTVNILKDQLIPNFAHAVDYAVNSLNQQQQVDDNGFVEASRLIYDGIHDVRNAVLMLYDNSFDTESEFDDDFLPVENINQNNYQDPNAYYAHYKAESEQEPFKEEQFINYPEEQREQIQKQLESFRQEKKNFDREVLKWDDKGNDIIVLAKQMCVIMMEMTDFTRGRGPLKTTMDIISAAKKISECGAKLDKLARDIAEECPESQSKRELDAYLKPIPLFCNQLNIASKVKANVIDVSGEPIITGLDSATSLIISAKNLMTAVVSVVKASYVASTKYTSKTGSKKPIVQWKMKAPEKKPLVLTPKPQDVAARVKKASQKKKVEPIEELSEFQA